MPRPAPRGRPSVRRRQRPAGRVKERNVPGVRTGDLCLQVRSANHSAILLLNHVRRFRCLSGRREPEAASTRSLTTASWPRRTRPGRGRRRPSGSGRRRRPSEATSGRLGLRALPGPSVPPRAPDTGSGIPLSGGPRRRRQRLPPTLRCVEAAGGFQRDA